MWTNIYNLADGHAWRNPSEGQFRVIERLGEIYCETSRRDFREVQDEFLDVFFRVAAQPGARRCRHVLSATASYSIDLVGAYCAEHSLSIGFIEPCFSHIAKMLRRRGNRVAAIPEKQITSGSLESFCDAEDLDAVFLCAPNNPTGFQLSKDELLHVAEIVERSDRLLVLDRAYGFFATTDFDVYDTLLQTNARFVVVEDTGKTWPTLDLKVGVLGTTTQMQRELTLIQDEVLLHVSPFTLSMLTEFLLDTAHVGFDQSVKTTIDTNRETLRQGLYGAPIVPVTQSPMSAEWLQLISNEMTGRELVSRAKEHGVLTLSGEFFFWEHPEKGSDFVRVALMRDPEYFAAASQRLFESLNVIA